MLGFLTALFNVISKLVTAWRERGLRQQGRGEQAQADIVEVQAHVEEAKAAINIPDPVRDERLRGRFDRSNRSK